MWLSLSFITGHLNVRVVMFTKLHDIEELNHRATGFINLHNKLMVNDDNFPRFCGSFYDK
jgi:hypothetical protein